MFKYLALFCLILVVNAKSEEEFNSFEEALEYEKSIYDFENNLNIDLGHFKKFKEEHNKYYENEEEEKKRFGIFRINLLKIRLLNKFDSGSAVYGVNHFADLEHDEFKQQYTGLAYDAKQASEINFAEPEFDRTAELPKEFDWREKGAVTEVKNQGSCGSCWAFSAVAAIESQNKIVNNELVSLSEEQVVDCDAQSNGCGGGWMSYAFEYLIKAGGLETEKDYPYKPQGKCSFNKEKKAVQISAYVNLTKNEDDIARYVHQKGPVSIAINANLMQFYLHGVAHPRWFLTKFLCSPSGLNHGVVIVGFGETTTRWFKRREPYWIIKNSWSKKWGRGGYYLIHRGSNSCGVAEVVSQPIVVKK